MAVQLWNADLSAATRSREVFWYWRNFPEALQESSILSVQHWDLGKRSESLQPAHESQQVGKGLGVGSMGGQSQPWLA